MFDSEVSAHTILLSQKIITCQPSYKSVRKISKNINRIKYSLNIKDCGKHQLITHHCIISIYLIIELAWTINHTLSTWTLAYIIYHGLSDNTTTASSIYQSWISRTNAWTTWNISINIIAYAIFSCIKRYIGWIRQETS